MWLVINWLIDAGLIFAMAYIIPGVVLDNFWIALVVSVVLGLLNALLKPLLLNP